VYLFLQSLQSLTIDALHSFNHCYGDSNAGSNSHTFRLSSAHSSKLYWCTSLSTKKWSDSGALRIKTTWSSFMLHQQQLWTVNRTVFSCYWQEGGTFRISQVLWLQNKPRSSALSHTDSAFQFSFFSVDNNMFLLFIWGCVYLILSLHMHSLVVDPVQKRNTVKIWASSVFCVHSQAKQIVAEYFS